MGRFDVGVVLTRGNTLRIGERLLKFGRKFVKTHGGAPNEVRLVAKI
jgi:hypothetical protein